MVTLSPPILYFVGFAVVRIGAVIGSALKHVRLIPHHFIASLHGSATQLIRSGSRGKSDVEFDRGCIRFTCKQVNLLFWFNNVN